MYLIDEDKECGIESKERRGGSGSRNDRQERNAIVTIVTPALKALCKNDSKKSNRKKYKLNECESMNKRKT